MSLARHWLALLGLSCLAPAPLSAQGEVRLVLVVTGGIPPYIRGELRISRRGQAWQGTLAVEDSDSLLPVTAIRNPGDSLFFVAPLLGGMQFAGLIRGDGFSGEARAADSIVRTWTANSLSQAAEFYPSLPRFTLRQIVMAGTRLPAPLPAPLASRLTPLASIDALYRSRAQAGGWIPLSGRALPRDRGARALGISDRHATLDAEQQSLAAIEAGITDPAVRRRFVSLFHPAGKWIIDLHDAAIRSAALTQPGFRLESIRPALTAIGESGADTATDEHLLTSAYRLARLELTDSTSFTALLENLGPSADLARKSLLTLLDGYQSALGWHTAALGFLLTDNWLPAGTPGGSVADQVRALGIGSASLVPTLRPRLLGYVQAFPHIRIPDSWVDSLVQAENPSGRDWLKHHGRSELLAVLRHLPASFDTATVISEAGIDYRLSTIGHEAAVRESGFLEPADEIVSEAGLSPLLSVQTVVHEWIHILHEHAREQAGKAWWLGASGSAHYQPVTQILAEGFAEWEAERAMASLLGKFPLLGIFETEKRAAMAVDSPDDPHLVGYRLVGGLAVQLGEPALIQLMVNHAADPDDLLLAAKPSSAKPPHRRATDFVARALLPQVRLTIDEVFPQVIAARIVTPFGSDR